MASGAVAGGFLPIGRPFSRRTSAATAQPTVPLAGSAIPQFVDELPRLGTGMVLEDGTDLTIRMQEFKADVMPSSFLPAPTPANPNPALYDGTWVWGYQTDGNATPTAPNGALMTYVNPVIVAWRGTPTQITWVNELGTGADSNLYWQDWTDQTLHWAMGTYDADHYTGQIPAVVHLHGGEVPPQLDGGPDAWFTADGQHGHAYWTGPGGAGNKAVYNYPNVQEAAPTWFHDHALGITRINVYAGLAGAYLQLDAGNPWPIDETRIIPLVIQDRMFDAEGQLFFPNVGLNPEHPFWVPEFEGDVICVNGKVWPRLTVANKRYAFWFLNGSNARTYDMFLTDPVSKNFGPPMWVIASGGGLLNAAVKLDPMLGANNSIVVMPGERYVVIIDFAGYEAGVIGPNGAAYSGTWLLKNTAKTPFPAGAAPDGVTTGRVMQFVVDPASTLPEEPFDVAAATTLRGGASQPPVIETLTPTVTRQLTLNEVMGAGGPLAALVNNTMWNGLRPEALGGGAVNGGMVPPEATDPETYYTEFPEEGTTELWEIVNLTADAHPIHLHLVQFQLQDRQSFNVNKYSGAYAEAFPDGVYIPEYGPPLAYDGTDPLSGGKLGGNPDIAALRGKKPRYLQGPAMPPLPKETGWKDTIIAYPGEVTRILVRWAPQDATASGKDYFPFDPNGGHGYVWHCHIIDHEDNEMMRPTSVISIENADRILSEGSDY